MLHVTLAFAVVVTAQAPTPPGPPAAPVKQLSKADVVWAATKYAEAVALGRAGKWGSDEAQKPIREILELCTRELGADHYDTAGYRREIEDLKKLAALPEKDREEYKKTYVLFDEREALAGKREYAKAEKPAGEMIDIYRRVLGPGSFYEGVAALAYGQIHRGRERHTLAERQFRDALAIFQKIVGEYHPKTIESYIMVGRTVERLGRQAEGKKLHETAFAIAAKLLGETHGYTAVIRNNLAGYLDREALYSEAEELYRKSVADLAAGGEDYAGLLATSRNNLAHNLTYQGKYEKAEAMYRELIESREKVAAPADIGLYSGNLGTNLDSQGRHVEAEDCHRRAVELMEKNLGQTHTTTATAYSNLAVNLDSQGKFAEGETYLQKALDIYLAAPKGEATIQAAGVYSNLASCLEGQGKYPDALEMARKAVTMLEGQVAEGDVRLAAANNNLATSLSLQEKYADAEKPFRAALAAHRKTLGEERSPTAESYANLSVNLYYLGRFAEAEPNLTSALAIFKRVLGEGHPHTASAYKNTIGLWCARGEYDKVTALGPAVTASFETARLRFGYSGLDRARRMADISPYPGLAVAAARRGRFGPAWQALEHNLARGLLDDLAASPLSADERDRELALLVKLEQWDKRIDVLRDRGAEAAEDRKAAEADRAATLAELARYRSELTARHGVKSGQVYDLDRVQKQLPDDTALVAWVDLPFVPEWHEATGDHWACLVKSTGEPVWVRLRGTDPAGAWTTDDEKIAARARRAFATRSDDPKAEWKAFADTLAKQRLAPLEPHLTGIKHLVVLPSGGMAGVPVEVLTDRTVTYAPSGTMFAWLREKRPAVAAKPARILLSLGDPTAKGDGGPAPLAGARQELAGISRVFDECREFKGDQANEQNLDRVAAEEGGLGRFPYLHFATHGVIDDKHPMRSALLLAPDRPVGSSVRSAAGAAAGGRLTAERMLKRWKLDAELVTLSACRTGLGKYIGGEGYLGFSQALFVAGARSLVLSLWEVDDTATALLMTRFYENLMGLPAGVPGGPVAAKPTKAEALAEAKQWLRTLSPADVDVLRKDLPRQGTRGEIVKKAAAAKAPPSYAHPYYWSGFVLVGDPR